jgi:hypothetical protein
MSLRDRLCRNALLSATAKKCLADLKELDFQTAEKDFEAQVYPAAPRAGKIHDIGILETL